VACSLCFNPNNLPKVAFLKTLNDSKKLSEKKRELIFSEIIKLSNLEKPQIYF
jgi:ribonuclease HII